jgi:hypothetical protein
MEESVPFPLLVAGIVAGLVAALLMLHRLRWALPVAIVMLFVASTGTQGDEITGLRLWLYPIQANRSPLFMALGTLLLVPVLVNSGRLSFRLPIQGTFLLAIGLYAGLLRIVHETPASGLSSIAFAAITIGPLLVLIPALVDDWNDVVRMMRAVMVGHLAWIGAVAIQFVINPSQLTLGKSARFLGITGNPQHAAAYLAVMSTIALWLFLSEPNRRVRLVWVGVFVINLLLLVWTGSRTGAGMFVIGTTAATYGRLGRTALYLPIVALVLWGGIELAALVGVDLATAQRLTSTEDTRSGAWLDMIDSAMKSPLIGVGVANAGDSENSYLYSFAAYGLGMIAIIALMMVASAVIGLRLFARRRRLDPQQRSIIDLVLAYNAMYFAGAFFEGYLIARVAAPLVLMITFSGIASRLLVMTRDEAAYEEEWDEDLDGEALDGADPGFDEAEAEPAWR